MQSQSLSHNMSHHINTSINQSSYGWPDLSFDFSVSGIVNESENDIQEKNIKLEEYKPYYCRSDDNRLLEVDISPAFSTNDCFVMTITVIDPFIGQDTDENIDYLNNLHISLTSGTQDHVYYPLFHNSSKDNKEFIFTLCTSSNFHHGNYYLIINDHNFSIKTDLKIVYSITSLLRNIAPLEEGKVIYDKIQSNEWKFYRFRFHSSNPKKVIQIKTNNKTKDDETTTGDVDIYVSNKYNGLIPVNNKNYIWRNVTPGASIIDIHTQFDKSSHVSIFDLSHSSSLDVVYTIGVFGCFEACELSNYSIMLSLVDPLPLYNLLETVDNKQPHTIRLLPEEYCHYKLPVQLHSNCRYIVNISVNNKDKVESPDSSPTGCGIYSTDSLLPLPSNFNDHDNICVKNLLFPVVYILDGNNSVMYASSHNYNYRASSIDGNVVITIEPLELLVANLGTSNSIHEIYLAIYGYDAGKNSQISSNRSVICHVNTSVEMRPVDTNTLLSKNDTFHGFIPSNNPNQEIGSSTTYYCELDSDILYSILHAVTISSGLIIYEIYCGAGRNIISLALNNYIHFFKCIGVEFDQNLSNIAAESINKLRVLAKDLTITLPLIDIVCTPTFSFHDLVEANIVLLLSAFLLDDSAYTNLLHNVQNNIKRGAMLITTKYTTSIELQLIQKQKFRLENNCGKSYVYFLLKL